MGDRPAKRQKTNNAAVFAKVDAQADYFVSKLAEMVAIKGVSAEAACRPALFDTAAWIQRLVEELGGKVEQRAMGEQTLPNGKKLALPPVVLAEFHAGSDKKTLCAYGHYDVQPASKEDGWNTEPFVMEEIEGKLFGRGTTDDKGPLLCWLWVVHVYKQLGKELPVNLKLVFEGMEESGSVGLHDLVTSLAQPGQFLDGVDFVCISDNYWLGRSKPCVTYGLRGNAYFYVEVKGPSKDLHSGVHGGAVREPMVDLVHLLSKLVTPKHEILVPGLQDMVEPVSEEEEKTFAKMDFCLKDYKEDVGVGERDLLHADEKNTLMHRWRFPALSIHGVEGAFAGEGAKTVIPAKVVGKFSIRTVPNIDNAKLVELVTAHVQSEWGKLGSPNDMSIVCAKAGRWWKSDPNHPNHAAARQAQMEVFGVEADLIREGGSIPITLSFEEATGKNVVLLPIGACDDGAHSQNEKLNRSNYINGVKVLAAYMENLAQL